MVLVPLVAQPAKEKPLSLGLLLSVIALAGLAAHLQNHTCTFCLPVGAVDWRTGTLWTHHAVCWQREGQEDAPLW